MMQIPHGGCQHHDVPGRKPAFQDQFSHGNGLVRGFAWKQTRDANTLPDDSQWIQLSARRCRRNSLSASDDRGMRRREEERLMRTPSVRLPHDLRCGDRMKTLAPTIGAKKQHFVDSNLTAPA